MMRRVFGWICERAGDILMRRKGKVLIAGLTAALAISVVAVPAAGPGSDAFADEAAEKWKCEKKSKVFEEHGGWKEAVRAYTNGRCRDSMSCSTAKKVNSTYSGELKVSIPKLESFALMKHEINKSFGVDVKYATSLKGRKKGTWAIQYRTVYNCRNVTQRKYLKTDKKWRKTSTKKKVKTKDFKSMAYRVVYLSPKNIARAEKGPSGRILNGSA